MTSSDRKYPPIIVIGMHRSGTTLVCRILQKMGVFMGIRRCQHEESVFFRRLNIWALRQANATWDMPDSYFDLTQFHINQVERVFRRHLAGLRRLEYMGFWRWIRSRNLDQMPTRWGWKDPRSTLTLNVWTKLFADAIIIHVFRHPIDVSASLQKREIQIQAIDPPQSNLDEFLLTRRSLYGESIRVRNMNEGLKLWSTYTQCAQHYRDHAGFRNLCFEDLCETPERLIRELARFLEMGQVNASRISQIIQPQRSYAYRQDPELVKYESAKQQISMYCRLREEQQLLL